MPDHLVFGETDNIKGGFIGKYYIFFFVYDQNQLINMIQQECGVF